MSSIGLILKVLALVLWLIAFAWRRLGASTANYDLVAAGLFFWFIGDLVNI